MESKGELLGFGLKSHPQKEVTLEGNFKGGNVVRCKLGGSGGNGRHF